MVLALIPAVRLSARAFGLTAAASWIALLSACSDSGGQSGGGPANTSDTSGFISYVPNVLGDGDGDGDYGLLLDGQLLFGGDIVRSGNGDGDGDGDGDVDVADPLERAISEADIIQLEGDRLHALSRYSGLSIIDVSNPTELRLLGNYRSLGDPFEMYLEGDVAYIMYNSWYSSVYDEATGQYVWQNTARMQAVDLSDPGHLQVIGDLEIPGAIADSRKVGDVIYLATHQSGRCWACDTVSNSRITSFDVSDPSDFTLVDREVFQTESGWQRSISVTSERIYISGFTRSGDQNQGGTLDVVDISDPSGAMSQGATVSIAGQVESRWQVDEFEETLRVISQPGGGGTTNPPVVETFQVNSASEIVPLASIEMVLPRPEDLRSVRFDGNRAFAITFERTAPLFTFDLSDPQNPVQLGELEIPGWVYHMEPRGDRIYALGYDYTSTTGFLHVSLFDVSDMENPVQLARVNFAEEWGGFAEDQDRIHKAFNILTDEGLILVPFYSVAQDEDICTSKRQNGIQLIDMTTDSLALRGVAPQAGPARRALLHEGALFGIGDNAVQSFDIVDRDAPEKLDQLDTARNVTNLRLMGSTMLRFGIDWWTRQTTLDLASLDAATSVQPLGELDLSALNDDGGGSTCRNAVYDDYAWSSWAGQVFVFGTRAFLPHYSYVEENVDGSQTSVLTLEFAIVDISDRTDPKLVGSIRMDPTDPDDEEHYLGIVKTESALLVGRRSYAEFVDSSGDVSSGYGVHYDIIDLTNPDEPEFVERFEVPRLLVDGGWGSGVEGCSFDLGWGWWDGDSGPTALVSGDIVVSQHQEPLKDGTRRVRYFLDRIDVSDPAAPELLSSVNIPGKVVHFDAETGRIVTLDYQREDMPLLTEDDCYEENTLRRFDGVSNVCALYRRRFNVLDLDGDTAILKDSRVIDEEAGADHIAISDSRIFYRTVQSDEEGVAPSIRTVSALAYDSAGEIRKVGEANIDANSEAPFVARGDRAFSKVGREFVVFDATGDDVEATSHEMLSYGCTQFEVHNDVAYCAMGLFGVQSFALD